MMQHAPSLRGVLVETAQQATLFIPVYICHGCVIQYVRQDSMMDCTIACWLGEAGLFLLVFSYCSADEEKSELLVRICVGKLWGFNKHLFIAVIARLPPAIWGLLCNGFKFSNQVYLPENINKDWKLGIMWGFSGKSRWKYEKGRWLFKF